MAAAVKEQRELGDKELAEVERLGEEMWARLARRLSMAEGLGVRMMPAHA